LRRITQPLVASAATPSPATTTSSAVPAATDGSNAAEVVAARAGYVFSRARDR